MSFVNKIPRGLRILAVILVLGVLIWLFASGKSYYYYCIGSAVLLTLGAIVLVYKPFKSSKSEKTPRASKAGEAASDSGADSFSTQIEADYTDSPSFLRANSGVSPRAANAKAAPAGITRNYPQTARPVTADTALKKSQTPRPAASAASTGSAHSGRTAGVEASLKSPDSAGKVPEMAESSVERTSLPEEPTAPKKPAAGSFINQIPRGLRVLAVMAVLGVLIWQFASGTPYYYYSIGAAVLLTFGTIWMVYKPFKSSHAGKNANTGFKSDSPADAMPETFEIEGDYTDTPSIMRNKPVTSFREAVSKPAAANAGRSVRSTSPARTPEARPQSGPAVKPASTAKVAAADTVKVAKAAPDAETGVPAIPLVEDESVLTEADKNQLVNAVWYRCENPYCKYTSFLGVHHIVEEKDGGTNRLDNLIVLCPYCHDLAHRGEIPVAEMQDWISNRENRFKFKPDWKYF